MPPDFECLVLPESATSAQGMPDYELLRSRRKTCAIHVESDGSVVVRAPLWVASRDIAELVAQKQAWIQRKRAELLRRREVRQSQRRALHNKRYYRGDLYDLKVTEARRNRVELGEGCLHVQSTDPGEENIQSVLNQWYGRQARALLPERLEPCMQRVREFGVGVPELRFRRMRARWGSCSSAGRIMLNTELIKANEACIDYVLTHELCHLREMNHSPRFYALMDAAMPDWRAHKRTLETLSVGF